MSKNTLNILVVSASSLSLARKIRDEYPGKTVIYCREADNDIEPVTSFKELTGNLFDKSETIVFIGAMGICVRSIAPYIKSKYTDPAVICLDSTGKYVVSVLSGHIGGANELTHELARILDAEAVVTTQSDNQGLWALDTFAKQYGWEQDVYNPQEGIISFFQTDFEKIDEETFNASREKAMNECEDQLKCAGFITIANILFTDMEDDMSFEDFFSWIGVDDYEYLLGPEVITGEGWLRFTYHDMEVMVNTNEAAPGGGWDFTGAEIVKSNAPVSIVDPEILNTNQDLAEAVMFD